MKVFIVYAHPSKDSFTYKLKNEFVKGLLDAGHTYEISDLYEMHFNAEMSEAEYNREVNYDCNIPVAEDIIEEQTKINNSDAIIFIYPVFWTEAPAKLVGWFDRVWTYGFAYGERTMKKLRKALVLCVAGRTIDHLIQHGHLESMEKVMLGDLNELTLQQKMILHCIYTRNCNGYVRQRHLQSLLLMDYSNWTIPYIVKLCDEYIIEILEMVYGILKTKILNK